MSRGIAPRIGGERYAKGMDGDSQLQKYFEREILSAFPGGGNTRSKHPPIDVCRKILRDQTRYRIRV